MSFRGERARNYGLKDALVVYGLPVIVIGIVAAALARLAAATIFGR